MTSFFSDFSRPRKSHPTKRNSMRFLLWIVYVLPSYLVSAVSFTTIQQIVSKMGQGVSTLQWFTFGKQHFRQTGYLKHIQSYEGPVQTSADICRGAIGADGVDLEGKVFIITGANSGIGKELATYVAAKGAKLYMLCRSKERAQAAKDEIVKATSNEQIKIVQVDVGELNQVRAAAEEIKSSESKVDCIICNAGVLLNEKKLTSEGRESTIASHLIGGSYLLPTLLLPELKAAGSEARVVFTTSGGMYLTKMPTWDIASCTKADQKYDGVMAYSFAKRGQVLLAERFAKVHPEITWISAHPGWTATAAVDDAFGKDKAYLEPMRNVWQGAEGISWVATVSKAKLENGGLYLDREKQKKHLPLLFTNTKNTDSEVDEFLLKLSQEVSL